MFVDLRLCAGVVRRGARRGRRGTRSTADRHSRVSIASSLPAELADPGGMRAALAAKGIQFQLNYIGEVLGDVAGGMRQGSIYDNRLELVIDADLEKLFGWQGAALHANGYWIGGTGLSGNYVGNLMTVSNIEALPTTRLYEAWFEQKLAGDKIAVRVGQLGADTEFITSTYASLFINSTFGWPDIEASDLPSGGPAYPLATPGVRLKLTPSDQFAFLLGLFDGNPAGPGSGNPQQRDLLRRQLPRDRPAAADRRGSVFIQFEPGCGTGRNRQARKLESFRHFRRRKVRHCGPAARLSGQHRHRAKPVRR